MAGIRQHPRHTMRNGLVTAVAAAALAAATAGVWNYARDHTSDTTTSTVEERVPAAPAPVAQAPAPVAQTPILESSQVPTVYLVSGPEAATSLTASLDEADAIRAATGLPSLPRQIVVAVPGDDEVLRQLIDTETVRHTMGLSGPNIVDLRAP